VVAPIAAVDLESAPDHPVDVDGEGVAGQRHRRYGLPSRLTGPLHGPGASLCRVRAGTARRAIAMSSIDRRQLLQGTAALAVTATLANQAVSMPAAHAQGVEPGRGPGPRLGEPGSYGTSSSTTAGKSMARGGCVGTAAGLACGTRKTAGGSDRNRSDFVQRGPRVTIAIECLCAYSVPLDRPADSIGRGIPVDNVRPGP
jgi:hypothetical protein